MDTGDIVALLDQGAYCEAVSTDFCAIPIPAAVVAEAGRADVTRPRSTVDEIVGRYRVPDWLGDRVA